MATTFKDFIAECELYPYSRENFEFMKECSEIALSEKYISDQVFLAEAREALVESTINIEEGFFQESVDESSLEVLTEKVNTKAKGLIAKILSKVHKIFRTFTNFLGKIGNKFDPATKKGQEVIKMLASTTLDDDQVAHIKAVVNDAKNAEASAFPIRMNQPYKKNVKLKYGGHDKEIDTLRNDLAVALSDDKVVAEALLNASNDGFDSKRIGIMDPEDLYDAAMALCVGKEAAVLNVAKSLYNSWTHVKKAGLTINVNTKNINKTAEKLNELCDKISETVTAVTNANAVKYTAAKDAVGLAAGVAVNTAENIANNAENNAADEKPEVAKVNNVVTGIASVLADLDANMPKTSEITNEVNKAVAMMINAIGLTTKVYTQLNAYRYAVITKLYDYLKSIK